MVKKRTETITEQLRQTVRDSEWSLNAIARAADMKHPSLFRFVHEGTGIRLDAAARLAAVFQMRLTVPKEPTQIDGQKKR